MARQFQLNVRPFVPTPGAPTVTPELAPTGTIQELAKASHANGDTLTFNDGTNPATVFEYRVTAGSVGAGHVKVDISGASTAVSVAAILTPLLVANGLRLSSATADGSALVTVVSDTADEALPYALTTSNVLELVSGMAAPTGSKTWTYKLVGIDADGNHSAASSGGSTAAGGSALGALNLNRVHWATDPANAVSVQIWRTADGAASTPTTLGLIGTVAAGVKTFDDTGLAGDAATAPSTNTTGVGTGTECASLRDKYVQFGGTFVSTNQIQGTVDNQSWENVGAAATGKGILSVPESWIMIRNKQTAYTSGTVTVWLAGHEER